MFSHMDGPSTAEARAYRMLDTTLFDLLQIEHALTRLEQAAPDRKRRINLDRIRAAIVEVRAVEAPDPEGLTRP